MQDLDALLIRPVAARKALPGLRKALLSCCQALLVPQLEETPAHKRIDVLSPIISINMLH